MSTIKISSLRKSFGHVDVLKGIDLDIRSGEFIVFVGPSGCGKSTLLRSIAGLGKRFLRQHRHRWQIVNALPPRIAG